MEILKLCCLPLFFLVYNTAVAQQNISILFINEHKRAAQFFEDHKYSQALDLYLHIHQKKGFDEDVVSKVAQCQINLNKNGDAELWLARQLKNKKAVENMALQLLYAEVLVKNGKYVLAKKYYQQILSSHPQQAIAREKFEQLNTLPQLFDDSLTYTINKLNVNSPFSDFAPQYIAGSLVFLSARDEKMLVHNLDATTQQNFLELYQSKSISKDSFSHPAKLKFLNSRWHDGPVAIYNSNKQVIFTRNTNDRAAGISQLQMFWASIDLAHQELSKIKPMPFNSSSYSVSHPAYDELTNTLYFVSNMPGGYGGTDIYKVENKRGTWSKPVNLGPQINTSGNEMFPYIFKDLMMCFSSSGHNGLGGLDIYYALKTEESFDQAFNVGYPINTSADDFSLVFSAEGQEGYFASNRGSANTGDDIYKFKIKHTLFEGKVKDKLGLHDLAQVSINLLENGKLKDTKVCNSNGTYYFFLKPGRRYELQATKEGYKDNRCQLSLITQDNLMQHTLLLERRNKSFVKVSLVDESQHPLPEVEVKIFEKSKLEQTLKTDNNGEARCELDAEVENIFVAEYNGLIATNRLNADTNSKGSMVLNVDLELKQFRAYKVEIILKSERTKKPLIGYEALVKNVATGEVTSICSDPKGKIQFKGGSYTTYDIAINFGSKTSNLYGLHPKQDHAVEVYWNDSN